MGDNNWLDTMNQQLLVQQLQDTNSYTEKFGLAMSKEDTKVLINRKSKYIKDGAQG